MSLLERLLDPEESPHGWGPDTTRDEAVLGVVALLNHLGYDTAVPGMVDTPMRVVKALEELTAGEHEDVADHLARVFPADESDHDEMIVVTGVAFTAMCEHHMMPFTGTAAVGYVPTPGAPVVGLSKLARVVEVYARRLTMQERITRQVTAALDKHLDTQGTACVIRSHHACMGVRGVKKPGASMVTSSLTGLFRDDSRTRDEFLTLAKS